MISRNTLTDQIGSRSAAHGITLSFDRLMISPRLLLTLSVVLAIGAQAPDFTLPDQNKKPVTLSATRGHKAVVVFYRGYW